MGDKCGEYAALSPTENTKRKKLDHLGADTDTPYILMRQYDEFGVVLIPLLPPNKRLDSAAAAANGGGGGSRDIKNLLQSLCHIECSNCVAKISTWIDLDSDDITIRKNSEITLKKELTIAARLFLKACLLPPPPNTSSFTNYARCVNRFLRGGNTIQFWLRIPHTDWNIWDKFRLLCDQNNKLSVCLDVSESLLSPESPGLLRCWLQEPTKAIILQTQAFKPNALGPYRLSPDQETQITSFFESSIKIVISGNCHDDPPSSSSCHAGNGVNCKCIKSEHFWSSLDYVDSLHQTWVLSSKLKPVEECYLSVLHADLCTGYMKKVNVKDLKKYDQYQKAIFQALKDKASDKEATVVMIAGIECSPLVKVALKAAAQSNRNIKVYAFGNHKRAAPILERLAMEVGSSDVVIVSADMHSWEAPEKADIFVSDFLGSFGDDEMSPEYINEAQKFLKNDGISIPSSYRSFIQPVTASKIHSDLKSRKDLKHFETPYFLNLDRVSQLASSKCAFEFSHPNRTNKVSNERFQKLQFELPGSHTAPALVHGFAGYFEATLFNDVILSTVPGRGTPNMSSWSPVFFPLVAPLYLQPGTVLEACFWRCVDSLIKKDLWYEWCVSSPHASPIQNCNGHASRGLDIFKAFSSLT